MKIINDNQQELDTNTKDSTTPSPEQPSGFILRSMKAKDSIELICESNHIMFLYRGRAIINSSEKIDVLMNEGQFCFMPTSAAITFHPLSDCLYLFFRFSQLTTACEHAYFKELWLLGETIKHSFKIYETLPPLQKMINELVNNTDERLMKTDYPSLKFEELLYMIRMIYPVETMADFFHPIASNMFKFRQTVLANTFKVKHTEDLAQIFNYKRKAFDRVFNREFKMPPYQWLLEQKAKHVYYTFAETDDQVQNVMRKYGFTMPPHFTRFCRAFFNASPWELKLRLRMTKESSLEYYS